MVQGFYGFEKKNGRYYVWTCGVRFRVSKETWLKLKKGGSHGEDVL